MKCSDTTQVDTLGKASIVSPLFDDQAAYQYFVPEDEKIIIQINTKQIVSFISDDIPIPTFELAGPRKQIYFDPSKLRCALVTCGGLCPGLNDIIRSIVLELYYRYGVKNISGIKYGLEGFIPKCKHQTVDLNPKKVSDILNEGGSVLGSSRGKQDIGQVVDCLERMQIGILFMIGGDGTLKAASKIADEITTRNLKISVIGIPKTIDNDIYMISRSFGFDTAVEMATQAIKGAHNEAEGYLNGIGLIKVMGRHSGFIAATAAIAQQDVNFVLIPEIDFDLEGENGLFCKLEKRLKLRKHAVILVAEGAGQKIFKDEKEEFDPSGNKKLNDIGVFLKNKIIEYFSKKGINIALKYFDPSYLLRSMPANSNDSVFCGFLGRDAVHAGMAGKTKIIIGHWNNHYVHIPMACSVGKRKQVSPNGKLWHTVLESTGQETLINS